MKLLMLLLSLLLNVYIFEWYYLNLMPTPTEQMCRCSSAVVQTLRPLGPVPKMLLARIEQKAVKPFLSESIINVDETERLQ